MSDSKTTSNLAQRVKTGLPLSAAIIALLFTPTFIVGTIVLLVAFLAAQELTNMLKMETDDEGLSLELPEYLLPASAILMGLGAIMGETGLNTGLMISVVGWIFYEMVFTPKIKLSELNTLNFGIFGMIWSVWAILHTTLVRDLPDGTELLFYLLFVVSFSDIFAYFGGKQFGKRLLAPTISPKKTWEGSFCGVIGGGLVGAIFAEMALSMFWLNAFLLAMFLAVIGQLGDLVESKIKRLCNVKDSGSILPGHGGILDRIDGHMLAIPVFYYLWQL